MNDKFDITKHKWSDDEVDWVDHSDNSEFRIYLVENLSVGISKDDAIAISKHFLSASELYLLYAEKIRGFDVQNGESQGQKSIRDALTAGLPSFGNPNPASKGEL